MNSHISESFKINEKAFGITIFNFGKSLFVWIGKHDVKFDSLFVSFPYKIQDSSKYSDDFTTTSLLDENEFGHSMASHICKSHKVAISLSMNIEENDLDDAEMRNLQIFVNRKIAEILNKNKLCKQ